MIRNLHPKYGMHLVAISWMFVVLTMAAAEATSTQGTLLGALFTLLLFGLLPLGIVLYIMATPARKRARRAADAQHTAASKSPDGGGHAPSDAVAPEREER